MHVSDQETTQTQQTILSSAWDQVKPGTQVSLTLTLQVDSQLADGVLIDNLAVVGAEGMAGLDHWNHIGNATSYTATLSVIWCEKSRL